MQIDFIDTIFHGVRIWIKSQILRFGDMSDEIIMFQHAKIITVLCRISYYYLPRPNNVKLKLKILIPLPPGLPSVAGSYHC